MATRVVGADFEQLRRVPKLYGPVLCASPRGKQAPLVGRPRDSLHGRVVVIEHFLRLA